MALETFLLLFVPTDSKKPRSSLRTASTYLRISLVTNFMCFQKFQFPEVQWITSWYLRSIATSRTS